MAELLDLVKSPSTYLLAILIFAVAPQLALQLMVRIYPKKHPRRKELIAECASIKRRERPFWVAENIVTVLFEGVPVRVRQFKKARRRRAARAADEHSRLDQPVKRRGSRIAFGIIVGLVVAGATNSFAVLSDPRSAHYELPGASAPFTGPLVPMDAATGAKVYLLALVVSLVYIIAIRLCETRRRGSDGA